MRFDGRIRRPLLRRLLLGLLRTFFVVETRGLENLPPPPYLLAGNHVSILDGPLIALLTPQPTVLLVAARFVRRPWVRPLLETSAGVIALGRGPDADAAVAGAIDALRAGLPVVMAPEGGVARAGLRRGRAGVVRIATGGGVPVLPMGWWGQDRLWNEWRHLRRPRVRIVFGPPLRLAPDDPPEMAAELVMRAIASLLPDAYRGDYRPA